MTFFDNIQFKALEARRHLDRMGHVIIHPRHRAGFSQHQAASLSCPGTIISHQWHEEFNAALNAFLSTARSIPDVIENQFGYDNHTKQKKAWLNALPQDEQTRRSAFSNEFLKKQAPFLKLPLNAERNEVHHGSGIAHWEVRVQGRWGLTYTGGPTNPLPNTETRPVPQGEDPALSCLMAASAIQPLEPMHTDFFWVIPQPNGNVVSVPLFPECRGFLESAEALSAEAERLFKGIHDGHSFTPAPW